MMAGFRQFTVTKEALADARRAGVLGNAETVSKTVSNMARRSAPFTHPQGNRRYMEFLLLIEDGLVKNLSKINGTVIPIVEGKQSTPLPATSPVFKQAIDCSICHGRMQNVHYEECEACDGEGEVNGTVCRSCDGAREVKVFRACPAVRDFSKGPCDRHNY